MSNVPNAGLHNQPQLGVGRTVDDEPAKFCTSCGKPAGVAARFCESCGHAFA